MIINTMLYITNEFKYFENLLTEKWKLYYY